MLTQTSSIGSAHRVRSFDHLVLAVRDLDAAAAFYERLGFRTTPRGIHPWGTHNRLVQFQQRSFLELLTIGEAEKIVAAQQGEFSFGAFNRDFLAVHEGMSMLVLASQDAAADLSDFTRAGLKTYAPFRFERAARTPDGSESKVAFELTFTSDPAIPHAGFFTCHSLFPDAFWKPAFMEHPNGVSGISTVTMVARDPADHYDFFEKLTGRRDPHMSSMGLSLKLANGTLDIISPAAFRHRFGEDVADTLDARFRAITMSVPDLESLRTRLDQARIPHHRSGLTLMVPSFSAYGVTLAFTQQ